MNNKQWYEVLTQAYGVEWELEDGFKWLNMTRWYDLSVCEMQIAISKFMDKQPLTNLTAQQVKYLVDRYGLRQVAERVANELGSRHRVYMVNLKSGVA